MGKVAEKLKNHIVKKLGLTVTEAADKLKISRPALSNVLNGSADLSMELAIKMQMEFGMDASKLLYAQLAERLASIKAQMDEEDDD